MMARTRTSLGVQLAEALDADSGVWRWSMVSNDVDGLRYVVHADDQQRPHTFTPGECAFWLNERGADVYIGKR